MIAFDAMEPEQMAFLYELYTRSSGDARQGVPYEALIDALGFDERVTKRIQRALERAGLVDLTTVPPMTHMGRPVMDHAPRHRLDLKDSDVQGPLSQFQMTRAEREETRKLLHTINKALEGRALQTEQLNTIFNKWWPDLDDRLKAIPPIQAPGPQRTERDLLEEVLETVCTLLPRPLWTNQTFHQH
jgi:hypothetical protein